MKPNFRMSVVTALVVVLSLAGPPHSQAQRPDQPSLAGDPAPDLERLRVLAGDGDAEAQFRLGEAYERGKLVERDLAKAAQAYRQAAEQGHPGAQYALAHLYHMGNGVAQDMSAAMAWYRAAARQGHEAAQLALGDQYRIGLIVPRDLEGSTKWYRRAAEQGNIFAQYELANAYRYGHGVAPDATEAAGWYRRSAEGGNPAAHLALAELLGGEAGTERGAAPPADPLALAVSRSFAARQKVSALLARAERQIESLALTTPAGANAYETYQEVLAIDRDNPAALAGIEEIGVAYAELAGLAAAKGDLESSRKYAAKASVLAPEHPTVLSMSLPEPAAEVPPEVAPEVAPEAPPLTVETLEEIKTPRRTVENAEAGEAKIQMAIATPAKESLEDLIEDPDDLLFNPAEYQDRPVAVVGRMISVFWNYRLIAEDGQNNMVVDVDGLSPAERDKLTAAFDEVGALAPVRARIKGTIERQGFGTFELAAKEVTLAGFAPRGGDTGRPVRQRSRDAVGPVAVSVDSDRAFGQQDRDARRTRSGDRDGGNDRGGGNDGGGGSAGGGGGSGGGSGGDGGSGSGGGSDSGGGNANGGNGRGGGDRDGGGRAGVGGNSGGGDRGGAGGGAGNGGNGGNGGKGGDRG